MRSGQVPGGSAGVILRFEGRAIDAVIGETLAAALTRAGARSLRVDETGAERGLFCGMGVCQECVVEVDGTPNRRACMTKITGAHEIRRQRLIDPMAAAAAAASQSAAGSAPAAGAAAPAAGAAAPAAGAAAPGAPSDGEAVRPEVLVLGGGAAGLTAAAAAAEAGCEVLLVDERPQAGGQYFKQPAAHCEMPEHDDPQFAAGRALIDRARRSGASFLADAEVWGAFPPLEIGVLHGGRAKMFRPSRLIVATGAYERGLPFPGWTLPGVMTTGAAQTLWRSYRTLPGKRVLVAGNGPLNLQVALELQRGGADVVAIAEMAAAPARSPASIVAAIGMLRSAAKLTMQGLAYVRELRRRGVPILYGRVIAEVVPADGALRATLRRVDGGAVGERAEIVAVDAVCTGYGFLPQNDILRGLGARHDFDPARGHLATRRDADCATTADRVWAAGDCCGLGGAPSAADEGTIAGVAVARSLGREIPPNLQREQAAARRRLPRHHDFQRALWRLFAAPRLQTELATDGTLICRCESVSRAAVEQVLAEGAHSIGEVKRATRLGMGRCQGRYCAPVLASVLARRHGGLPQEFSLFAPRAPIKPVTIAELLHSERPTM